MKVEVQCPQRAKAAARKDPRITEIAVYPDGWVPNSYKWPAPGRRVVFGRNGSGHWIIDRVEGIDRKCSFGARTEWVAKSEKGGRLASG